MKGIQSTAILKIHDGKLSEFKGVAEKCLQIVSDKDNGTLQYDWFLNEDQSVCEVREKYKDSNAALEHMGNLGDVLGALLSTCDMALSIYGSPSEQLLTALDGMDVKYYQSWLSLGD